IGYGVRKVNRSLLAVVIPEREDNIVELVYSRRFLKRAKKIAVIGGGTGLHNLLRGLKAYTSNLSAIVTVADDGGSSGRIRRELNIPPPGDIRNCLIALAEAEPAVEKLFQYRFDEGEELKGHSVGNLLLAAMTIMSDGRFDLAVDELSRILAIRGRVIPAALRPVTLIATMSDGTQVAGESHIPEMRKRVVEMKLEVSTFANPEAIKALEEADFIILGPGSLFTSIVPNLLVDGIANAISASPATKIHVCNVMTQPGETLDFSAEDHLRVLLKYVDKIDFAVINKWVPNRLKRKYELEGARPVKFDVVEILKMGIRPVVKDLMDLRAEYAWHDPNLLAQVILELSGQVKKPISAGGF
ncbi:MAG: gluconeogenesis factor YvcK family protein, partial [bacterium]